jgi:hypothetical protein
MNFDDLKKLFDYFSSPFLPEGFVQVSEVNDIYDEPALNIQIGDREITFLENGTPQGAGTNVGDGVKWEIKKKTIKKTKEK